MDLLQINSFDLTSLAGSNSKRTFNVEVEIYIKILQMSSIRDSNLTFVSQIDDTFIFVSVGNILMKMWMSTKNIQCELDAKRLISNYFDKSLT